MLLRARSQPAWVITLTFGLLAGALTVAVEPGEYVIAAGAYAVLLLIALAVVLIDRPDGEGWGIFSVMLLPSLALQAFEWARFVEAFVYVCVATTLAAVVFGRRSSTPAQGPSPAPAGGTGPIQ